MATENQNKYIIDLAVQKTKDFKEVKELLVANDIVKSDSETVANAKTLAEINNALTDSQASRLIDILINMKDPVRSRVYSQNRINKAVEALDDIKSTIDNWDFS